MVLIIGGSYQGKLDFACQRFSLSDDEIQVCDASTENLDFSKRCVAYTERFALNRVRAGVEPTEALGKDPSVYRHMIFIAGDISGGVVPMDPVLRAWREACGRMNLKLAKESDEVWRLFCGIPQRIK